jgi:hypothetical protein
VKITYLVRFEKTTAETNAAGLDECIEALLDIGAEVEDIHIEVRL